LLFHLAGTADQLGKTFEGIGAILLLGAALLRLNDHHPVGGDTTIGKRQQTLLVERRQRRSLAVEAQVHGTGHLVDVLPTGALGADGGQFDFIIGKVNTVGDDQHGHDFLKGMASEYPPQL
jgi:hypothetical protein